MGYFKERRKRTRRLLGFNDWPLILLGIPAVSLLLLIVFFNSDPWDYTDYCTHWAVSCFFTSIYWFVNRNVLMWAHSRYPSSEQTRTRVLFQFTMITLATVGTAEIIELLQTFFNSSETQFRGWQKHLTSLLTSYFIATVYETVYLAVGWQKSQKHTEELKKEQLMSQLTVLKNQVNPHFLFNSLNTLVSLIPDDQDRAIDFVQNLSRVYRRILEVREKELISLSEELEFLKAYQFLLETRFGANLRFEIDITKEAQRKFIV
ncbi:MAG: histidine kinase, partial [Flavobacteriales bacterium]|nr:histidine kinase [Flavobacteriales bacterium]